MLFMQATVFVMLMKTTNREIKHHVQRQTANVCLQSIFFTFPPIESIRKIENNSHVHDKRETTHYSLWRRNGKRQTAKVGFLPFAGKTNVMLNLSIETTWRVIVNALKTKAKLSTNLCILPVLLIIHEEYSIVTIRHTIFGHPVIIILSSLSWDSRYFSPTSIKLYLKPASISVFMISYPATINFRRFSE